MRNIGLSTVGFQRPHAEAFEEGRLRADGDEASGPAAAIAASSSAREIAEQYDIPIELLAKVLQRLVRRGLLASHQGTRGGYQLARPAAQISVADVIQAIDGPVTVTACSTDEGQLRAVREVQRPRSAVADSRADSGGARRVHDRRAGGRRRRAGAGRRTPAVLHTTICRRARADRRAVTVGRRTSGLRGQRWPSSFRFTWTITPRRRSIRGCVEAMLPYLHRALRQRGEPQPSVRLGGRGGGREGAQAGRRSDRREREGDRLHERRDRVRTTSRSRASPRCTARRAITSSRA